MANPIERLRALWTPASEVAELVADLSPQSELDSMIRDFLCRVVEQRGPQRLRLDVPNTGSIRWEIVHHEPTPGQIGHREVTIWHEPSGP